MDKNYGNNEIKYRRSIMYEKIYNMNENVKTMFDKRYPNLLKDLEPYIKLGNTFVPDENKEEINEWWDF